MKNGKGKTIAKLKLPNEGNIIELCGKGKLVWFLCLMAFQPL